METCGYFEILNYDNVQQLYIWRILMKMAMFALHCQRKRGERKLLCCGQRYRFPCNQLKLTTSFVYFTLKDNES